MLSKSKTLTGYKLEGLDGEIGTVKEFYFDDRHWTIRYLVAETGNWLVNRQVLISPYALVSVKHETGSIEINLTRKQIEDSPSLNTDTPVSRQFEDIYYGFYGWPGYWNGQYRWGSYPYLASDPQKRRETNQGGKTWDSYLRSTHDVIGHHIHAYDGEMGHVADFIIDEETWAIRYLIIDTANWWAGKKVLVSPHWTKRISFADSTVFVDLTIEAIKQSPENSEETLLTRDYEAGLHRHYGRQGYWVDESAFEAPVM